MALMAAHLRDSRDVQVLSALLFGYQAAVAPDLREAFLRSGTIHVLSVSGLHVVILGSIFVLLLRLCGVPFRWRYALLPFLVGVYVLMAGNAPAAQRAWLMISLWAAGQALLRPVNSLNSVATAGLILLCLNPLCVGQTGVQFSFVLVVALVGGWRVAQPLRAVLCERNLWIPRRCRTSFWHTTLFPHAVDLATGSMIGWLASAGLIAWVNGRFIPSALIVNFGIGAGAWLVLFLASVKLIFGFLLQGFWNGLDVVLARSLETVLHLIGLFAEWGSLRPGSLPVPRPELAVVLLFYAALAVALLVPGPWRWRPLALLSVCGSLAAMVLAPRPVNHAAVFSGDGAAAPVVVLCGDRVSPVILNSGPRRLTLAVEQWLTGHGFDRAEALVLPAAGFAESAKRLTESVAPRTLLLPPRETAGLAAVRGLQETLGGRVRHLQAAVGSPPATEAAGWSHVAVQVVRDREVVRVEVTLAGTGSALALSAEQQPDRGTRLRLRRDGATSACRFAPLALRPRLVEISL
jgi:ComEC/Rec2-related protein